MITDKSNPSCLYITSCLCSGVSPSITKMYCTVRILATLVFLAATSYGSPVNTYSQQVEQIPYIGQGNLVDSGSTLDMDPSTSTYYPLAAPDTYPLLDNVQTSSAQDAQALSNSNQYDQVQLVDQTLFQPSTPVYVQQPVPNEDEDKDWSDDSDRTSCKRCERRHRRRGYRTRY